MSVTDEIGWAQDIKLLGISLSCFLPLHVFLIAYLKKKKIEVSKRRLGINLFIS